MYKILSVGGSIVIPKNGFEVAWLKKFRALILAEVKKGQRFILVIGGGATCRQYQSAAAKVAKLTSTDLDWLGIKSTVFNAEFVRTLFKGYAYEKVVTNPTRRVKTSRPIIVAAGWKPGCSTDKDAALLAKTYGASEVINLSNIDYVYTSDPKKNPQAKKIIQTNWPEFRKIIGDKWKPGANLPFDPGAAKAAERLGLAVKFVKGTALGQVKRALSGGRFSGSIIL